MKTSTRCSRGFSKIDRSTLEAGNQGLSDLEQLTFAREQGRAILTFNVRDFVRLAREFVESKEHHAGIIVSDHLPFRELLARVLRLLVHHAEDNLSDTLLWLQLYKRVEDR